MSILTLAAKAVSAVRCDDMATTSIWRVKGWLGKVVIYVENPDKTENPAFYEKQEMTDRQTQGLSDVIDYAVSSEKTKVTDEATEVMQQFVSGVNCHPATAREEMIAVKKRFGKEDGTVAYHGYQSFAPGEATPEMAHEIGAKLAQQLWGDKYQVIVATHLDKDSHLHNHFVVNTVSFLDGLKYHRTEKDYYEMQKASDALCREYNLSVIENPQRGKSKQYGEWRAEQEGRPTWRGLIRAEIDEVIRQSMTERQFFDNLRKRGYEVKVGKDISVRPPGKERFVRLERNFGEDYSYDGIPLWAVTLIGGLFITVLSFIMIMTVYGRFFKLYLYTAIAPIPLSSFAGEPSQNVGKSFIKSYAAVCLEGAIIVLACIIFSLFAASPPTIDPNAAAVSMVWSYIGELVFNMLVLVGAVKMADRVVREMMGL